jgi:deoxyribonuclease V
MEETPSERMSRAEARGAAMHDWDVTVEQAVAIQQRLRPLVRRENALALDQVRTIAGVDASYRKGARAAVVLLAFPELEVLEQVTAVRERAFPYVPGLLSFREAPAAIEALEKLRTAPDLLMCDGQGIAHPRRLGLASHLGVVVDRPSIGCAKSRLVGTYQEPGPEIGDRSPLIHRGEQVGMVVRSKPRTNPLFISIGHKIDLETAVAVVLRCLRGYRLPEPTRLADKLTHEAP